MVIMFINKSVIIFVYNSFKSDELQEKSYPWFKSENRAILAIWREYHWCDPLEMP